jgi:transposase
MKSRADNKPKASKESLSKSVLPSTPMRARKKQAKARTVGALTVQGKTNREIASAIKSSESYVKKLKRESEAQAMMDAFFQNHLTKLRQLEVKSLNAVDETLSAGLAVEDKHTKKTLYLADHKVRMAAVQRVQDWQKMSQPKDKIPLVTTISIEELERRVKESSAE